MKTREEHLAWCKARALEYLPDDPIQAVTSMASDLGKHPETEGHAAIAFGMMLLNFPPVNGVGFPVQCGLIA